MATPAIEVRYRRLAHEISLGRLVAGPEERLGGVAEPTAATVIARRELAQGCTDAGPSTLIRLVDTQQVVQSSGKPAARGRLAEVAALFASSADFATGMPLDTTFRITGAALWLAAMLRLPESDRIDLYYLCLVRLMGCTVDNSRFAAAMGDELEASRRMAPADMASPTEMLPILLGLRAREPLLRRAGGLLAAVAFGAGMRSHIAGHCEVSQLLTDGLELGPRIRETLAHTLREVGRSRGSRRDRGEAIPQLTRLLQAGYHAAVQLATIIRPGRRSFRSTPASSPPPTFITRCSRLARTALHGAHRRRPECSAVRPQRGGSTATRWRASWRRPACVRGPDGPSCRPR